MSKASGFCHFCNKIVPTPAKQARIALTGIVYRNVLNDSPQGSAEDWKYSVVCESCNSKPYKFNKLHMPAWIIAIGTVVIALQIIIESIYAIFTAIFT